MIMARNDVTRCRTFRTTLTGSVAAILLYAGLLAIGFSRMAQVAHHF